MSVERSGEYRGKTVDAAISAALTALRATREQVEIEVIRPGSRGMLGIGAEDAIIRVSVKAAPRPDPKPVARTEPQPAAPPAPKPETAPEPRAQSASSRSHSSRPPKPVAAEPAGAAAQQSRPRSTTGDKEASSAELGAEILTGLLERMGLRARVEVVEQSELEAGDGDAVMVLNIVGDDLGVLIGRQNEVMSALELVTRLMVNQRSHTHSGFVVDVNGHRARRAEALQKLALRMAEQALESGRTMTLEPMPPSERRIVHMTLRENPKVTTQSVGEGDHRKVTIIPVKN